MKRVTYQDSHFQKVRDVAVREVICAIGMLVQDLRDTNCKLHQGFLSRRAHTSLDDSYCPLRVDDMPEHQGHQMINLQHHLHNTESVVACPGVLLHLCICWYEKQLAHRDWTDIHAHF
eukprot:197776-Amphidinium_carterae.1